MTAVVKHTYTAGAVTTANPSVTVTDTPAVGDVLMLFTSSGGVAITGVSGCGAAWSRVPGSLSASNILDAWIGVGATTSGVVAVTADAREAGRAVAVRMVSGVSATAVGVTASGASPVTSPVQSAAKGQIVFGLSYSFTGTSTVTATAPTTGWTEPQMLSAGSLYFGTSYRVPTGSPEAHSLTSTASGTTLVSQIVVGVPDLGGKRTNRVSNPTFESGITGWSPAIDAAGGLAVSTAQAHAGTQSALLTNTSGANSNVCALFGASGTTIAATASAIPVIAGQRVDAVAMMRGLGFGGTTIATIYWMNAAGSQISTVSGGTVNADGNLWRQLKINATAPANATQFAVGVRAFTVTPGNGVYIDSVIAEVGTGSVSNTYDTYFDGSTTASGYEYVWTGTPHASASTETRLSRTNVVTNPSAELDTASWPTISGATRTQSSEQAHSGTYSQKLALTGTSASLASTNFTILPNRLYSYSFWVYASRAIGARIASSANGFGASYVTVPANTWTRVSSVGYQLQADAGAQDLRIQFNSTLAGDVVYVDDVLMEQGTELLPYFDGASTGSGYAYAWTGTPHASASTELPAGPPAIAAALSGLGTLSTALTNYVNLSSGFSGAGALSTAWKDYRNLYSGFAGSGVLTTLVVKPVTLIASSFSGQGALTTTLDLPDLVIESAFTGEGTLQTLLGYITRINSDFTGEGVLFTELAYTLTPPPRGATPLGRLASFSVNTAAVPANPAEGSGSTPSVSASYKKGLDPEFALGETNVLKNGVVGTYEGEIVSVTTSPASAVARISMDTLLTPLNVDMHLFPFIDGVPGLWTAARAIDYWTQQCGVFYDKVPGDAIAYASGFGHTDSFGASTTARFYERLTGGATTTQVVNGRSVKTLGSAVTGTTAFHELKNGSVAVSLPANRKLVFSTGLGLLGSGRTATVRWNFLDSKDAAHTVSLEATSAGAVSAKLGADTIASASVPAGATYRLALSLERLSPTSLVAKLTVHTDDLAGAGTLAHEGSASVVDYPLPGVMRLTSLEHVSAGGSGAQMTRWGAYLTVAEGHPMELPAVQKVLGETKKPFSFVSGFEGNVWNLLNEFCSIAKLDVRFLDAALHVAKRTTVLSIPGGSWSQFETTSQRREKYKQVAVVNKQSKAVATDDAVLWRADSVFSVAAREVFETTVQTEHSILNLVQPVAVSGILPFPYIQGGGQYVVTGADGYIISPAWWNDNGGKVEVSLTGKEGEIAIKITAPGIDTVRAPYRISEGEADRPALYVCGSGIMNDPKEVHIATGAKNAREGFDSVFESPFVAGVMETYDTAAAMAHEYSASASEARFELPNDFDTPTGLGQFPAGTLVTDNVRNYRITDAQQTHSRVSGNAVPHTTIGAYVASYPAGATIADEKARHAGRTIRKFNIKPLKGDA